MPYTLTINFTLANPNSGNYRIKYWPQNNPSNITTTTAYGTPFSIYNLNECAYSGTIETTCIGMFSTAQPFSVSICPNVVSYTPCALVSSNGLTPSDIYLESGVTDIAPGVQLYDSNRNIITTVTQISDSNGMVYNVGPNGIVTTSTGNTC